MNLGLPVNTLFAFLLVLARVGGMIAFLPVPGFLGRSRFVPSDASSGGDARPVSVWPSLPNEIPSLGTLAAEALAEAGFGLVTGLAVGFLTEAFQLGAQILGLPAGFGYATTIDPTSQADAGVLQVVTMLSSGLLFFGLGIDRELFRILAASFEKFPAGTWTPTIASLNGIVRLGSGMFSLGLRMAMPVVALLLLIDLSLALLGRMQQHLQLLSLAFPLKMLAALALLAALAPVMARLFEDSAARTLNVLWRALGA